MAYEDFTTYDETDEGDNVTVAQNKVSWEDLARDETSHVSSDKGVNHFGGDFEHLFECQYSGANGWEIHSYWAIANVQQNMKEIDDAGGDYQAFTNANEEFKLKVIENGGTSDDTWADPVSGTTYYITLARDDDGGANNTGQLTAEIRITSHSGELKATLTVDCAAGEQNDFRYVFGLMSYDDGEGSAWADGYTENLDLQEAAPPAGGQMISIQISKLLPLFWLKQGKNRRRDFLKNTILAMLGMR